MAIHLEIQKKLGDFDLDINIRSDSRKIGILGRSGSGKSMTLKCIAGIESPDRGIIMLDDRVLYHGEKKINPRPQERNVGYLFQNYALFPNMTVRDNIGAGIKRKKSEKKEIVDAFIRKFELEGLDSRLPMELSGGQQQRVALARIMAYEPDAILLDEPFSALDIHLKDRLQHELSEMLKDYSGTVIMVSHSRDEIYRFSKEVLVIDQGHTVCFDKTEELFSHPGSVEAARITGCKNIVKAEVKGEGSLYIPDWGLLLHLSKPIPENTTWMGIRAHDFLPVWGQRGENMIAIMESRIDQLPFETNYYIRTNREQKEDICWFVQRESQQQIIEKGMPDNLLLPEDKILLLY